MVGDSKVQSEVHDWTESPVDATLSVRCAVDQPLALGEPPVSQAGANAEAASEFVEKIVEYSKHIGTITPAAGSTVRQEITIQSGIPIEKCREIVKKIKDSKIKVQASIQADLVRVSGKSRDLLQEAIALLRQSDFGIELQFTNYRTF